MSMQVPVELLPEVVRGYGQSAYAVVSDPAGPPESRMSCRRSAGRR